ncbi:hypothetical protein FSP39_022452 [Pinctada imbricata]|uniref:Transmembrane protein 14C n=1 Tax=Pinctada imbricata TaxID=66713 RepID=A0AA89BRV4_PINIB|nr:hypothetical protein FSP39_022452 [Pinctada imbricata]
MPLDIASAAYAVTIAAGGLLGYVKAGSVPSLAAGLAFGSVMGIGAYQTSQNPDNYGLSLATSTVLAGLMGYRFATSGKFMPAGLVATLRGDIAELMCVPVFVKYIENRVIIIKSSTNVIHHGRG